MNINNNQFNEDKVIILYIIDILNIPVSNLHLIDIILGNRFMNYFSLQTALDELLETGMLLETKEDGKIHYTISHDGKETVNLLIDIIPNGIRKRIDAQQKSIRSTIKRDLEVNAEYTIDDDNNHFARCFVRDGNVHLIDFNILAGNKKLASEICDNWKNHTQEIYSEIIELVLKNRDIEDPNSINNID